MFCNCVVSVKSVIALLRFVLQTNFIRVRYSGVAFSPRRIYFSIHFPQENRMNQIFRTPKSPPRANSVFFVVPLPHKCCECFRSDQSGGEDLPKLRFAQSVRGRSRSGRHATRGGVERCDHAAQLAVLCLPAILSQVPSPVEGRKFRSKTSSAGTTQSSV